MCIFMFIYLIYLFCSRSIFLVPTINFHSNQPLVISFGILELTLVLSFHVLYPLKCPTNSSHDLSLPTSPDVCYSKALMWSLGELSPPFSLVPTKHLVRRLVGPIESHSKCPLWETGALLPTVLMLLPLSQPLSSPTGCWFLISTTSSHYGFRHHHNTYVPVSVGGPQPFPRFLSYCGS